MTPSRLLATAFCLLGVTEAFVAPRTLASTTHPKISVFELKVATTTSPSSSSVPTKGTASRFAPDINGLSRTKGLPIPDPEPFLRYPAPVKKPFRFMPLRTAARALKFGVGAFFLGMLFVLNSIAATLFVFVKFWMRKVELRRYGGFKTAYNLPPLLELQFDVCRWLSYVPYLLSATDKLFQLRAKMFSADELVGPTVVPTDAQFISQVILRSPMAFYTNNTATKLVTDMSALNDIDNFPGTYYDVNKIEIDKATSQITIHTKDNGAITKGAVSESEWDRAKVHAMASMSYWVPGIGHSWVHFNLMDCVAATAYNELDRSTVLYGLLEPHTRYTNRINWEALGVQGPLVLGGSALVRLGAEATSTVPRGYPVPFPLTEFEPFTAFSFSQPEFVRNNAKRTTDYYFRSEEFACPPKWLSTPEADIPYIKSLKRYYPVVRRHVERVLSYEDDETVTKFIEAVDRNSECDGYSLNLTRFDPVDVIASVLFDCVFIHSTDHHATYEIFAASRYGIGTLRNPMSRWWFPGMNVPGDMLDEEDRVRWRNFADVFVRWNDSKFFTNGFKTLKYRFRRHRKELKDADRDFVKAIEDEQLAMKKDGLTYTPMEAISRSICW